MWFKNSPLKLVAIFYLLVNLCNWKLPWLLPIHVQIKSNQQEICRTLLYNMSMIANNIISYKHNQKVHSWVVFWIFLYLHHFCSIYLNVCVKCIIFTVETPHILRIQFSLIRNSWICHKNEVTSNVHSDHQSTVVYSLCITLSQSEDVLRHISVSLCRRWSCRCCNLAGSVRIVCV